MTTRMIDPVGLRALGLSLDDRVSSLRILSGRIAAQLAAASRSAWSTRHLHDAAVAAETWADDLRRRAAQVEGWSPWDPGPMCRVDAGTVDELDALAARNQERLGEYAGAMSQLVDECLENPLYCEEGVTSSDPVGRDFFREAQLRVEAALADGDVYVDPAFGKPWRSRQEFLQSLGAAGIIDATMIVARMGALSGSGPAAGGGVPNLPTETDWRRRDRTDDEEPGEARSRRRQ